jgi:hypothetical protein
LTQAASCATIANHHDDQVPSFAVSPVPAGAGYGRALGIDQLKLSKNSNHSGRSPSDSMGFFHFGEVKWKAIFQV